MPIYKATVTEVLLLTRHESVIRSTTRPHGTVEEAIEEVVRSYHLVRRPSELILSVGRQSPSTSDKH